MFFFPLCHLINLSCRGLCLKAKREICTICSYIFCPLCLIRRLTPMTSFFAGCHLFVPLFDPAYDNYESLTERTPWTFDAILAIAARIRCGNGPFSPTFFKCLEEAQGIARSSLFGPAVRKEAVQGAQYTPVTVMMPLFTFCRRDALIGGVEFQRLASKRARNADGVRSWVAPRS
jgi:hypothetical protein